MRVHADDDIRSLLEETLQTAKAAKRAAEDNRLMLVSMQIMDWVKGAIFLVLAVGVIYLGWRAYGSVKRMTAEFNAQAALQDAAPLFLGTDSPAE